MIYGRTIDGLGALGQKQVSRGSTPRPAPTRCTIGTTVPPAGGQSGYIVKIGDGKPDMLVGVWDDVVAPAYWVYSAQGSMVLYPKGWRAARGPRGADAEGALHGQARLYTAPKAGCVGPWGPFTAKTFPEPNGLAWDVRRTSKQPYTAPGTGEPLMAGSRWNGVMQAHNGTGGAFAGLDTETTPINIAEPYWADAPPSTIAAPRLYRVDSGHYRLRFDQPHQVAVSRLLLGLTNGRRLWYIEMRTGVSVPDKAPMTQVDLKVDRGVPFLLAIYQEGPNTRERLASTAPSNWYFSPDFKASRQDIAYWEREAHRAMVERGGGNVPVTPVTDVLAPIGLNGLMQASPAPKGDFRGVLKLAGALGVAALMIAALNLIAGPRRVTWRD